MASRSSWRSTRLAVGRVVPAIVARSSWRSGITIGEAAAVVQIGKVAQPAHDPLLDGEVESIEQVRRQPAHLSGEQFDQQPVDGGVRLPELIELAPVQAAHLDRLQGDGARRPDRRRVEERLLTEAVAATEDGEGGDVAQRRRRADGHTAALDDEQRLAGIALVEQCLVLAVAASNHRRDDRPLLLGRETAEQAALHERTIGVLVEPSGR